MKRNIFFCLRVHQDVRKMSFTSFIVLGISKLVHGSRLNIDQITLSYISFTASGQDIKFLEHYKFTVPKAWETKRAPPQKEENTGYLLSFQYLIHISHEKERHFDLIMVFYDYYVDFELKKPTSAHSFPPFREVVILFLKSICEGE